MKRKISFHCKHRSGSSEGAKQLNRLSYHLQRRLLFSTVIVGLHRFLTKREKEGQENKRLNKINSEVSILNLRTL